MSDAARFAVAYELTDAMAGLAWRQAYFRHMRRAAAIYVAYWLLLWLLCRFGPQPWMCGLFVGMGLLLGVIVAVAYVTRSRAVRDLLRRLPHRRIRWEIGADGVKRESALGDVAYPWSFFDDLVVTRDFQLLLVRRQLLAFLPRAALSPEIERFVVERVRAAGGTVSGA